jgi:hypothetical protein
MTQQSINSDTTALGAEANPTYHDLLRVGRELQKAEGKGERQIANYKTALTTWCSIHSRPVTALVAQDFGDGFDALFCRYLDIQKEELSKRTVKDRGEHLLWWREMFSRMRAIDSLPARFCDALGTAFERSGLTKAALCRHAGISAPTLDRWLSGQHLPERASAHLVAAAEKALDLSTGVLMRRLPVRRRPRYERGEHATARPMTSYGKRLQANRKKLIEVAPNGFGLVSTERLRAQWQEVLALKTDIDRKDGTVRNTWSLKTPDRVGQRVHWSMLIDGSVCVTAGGQYRQIASFLGYLALPTSHGGFAIPTDQLDSLAWLVRADLVIRYVKWVRQRAGGIRHNGLALLLNTMRSHLRPATGYVWLHPDLAATLPASEWPLGRPDASQVVDVWKRRCSDAYATLMDYTRKLKKEGKPKKSRDPEEPLEAILASEFPMRELLRVIRDVEADPPPVSQELSYAAWIRDVLMLKMINRHPLRANHFSVMTFRGPKANLKRVGGSWQMHFDLDEFKNRSVPTTTDYTVMLDPSLTEWLNRYLNEARHMMVRPESDYIFLPSRAGYRGKSGSSLEEDDTGAWSAEGIYQRVKILTSHYTVGGIGLNLHGFRHVAASDHLRRHPKEYTVVAQMLNDKLETVIREYAHTETENAARVLNTNVAEAEAALAHEVGQR